MVVLKNVLVKENVKMVLVFVMNSVDGEGLCVKYRVVQESKRIVVDMVAAIALTKHVYVIQVSKFKFITNE